MIHPATLRRLIRETLAHLPPPVTDSAVELLVLTHAHEGTYWGKGGAPLTCFWQLGKGLVPRGPALGIYQMEGKTHDDLWRKELFNARRRGDWSTAVADLSTAAWDVAMVRAAHEAASPPSLTKINMLERAAIVRLRANLPTNLAYATAMARYYYYTAPAPLPPADDVAALAAYWHQYWCRGCKGTPEQAAAHYRAFTGEAAGGTRRA